MKRLIILAHLIPVLALSQSTTLPLNFSSYAISLGVSKDESLSLTSRMGEIGMAGSIQGNWQRSVMTKPNEGLGPMLDQSNFFNKDTGFVSGFIFSINRTLDIIYHTTNGGRTWNPVNFGQKGWVEDAVNLDNGEAWLSVGGSGIAYTSDYGFTWEKLNNPDIKYGFTTIFFNPQKEGIAGAVRNMIGYTTDNCATWKLLPTPLDQKKYNKTIKDNRAYCKRVAIFKNYFLVAQEDLVFYSKRDSIDWIWLPDYNDFYTDPENSALFFSTNKGSYVRADNYFKPVYTLKEESKGYDAKCRNGSLFIVTESKMIRWKANNQVDSHLFATTAVAGVEPVQVGYTKKGKIGVLENKIFLQRGFKSDWDTLFTFPFSLAKGKVSITKEQLLLYDRGDDSLFYIDLTGKVQKSVSKSQMIDDFVKNGIHTIIFSQGSQGCYHNYADSLIYTKRQGAFEDAIEIRHDSIAGKGMPGYKENISAEDVLDFAQKLPQVFDPAHTTTITDLEFTQEDYKQCKKNILAFGISLQMGKPNSETGFYFHKNNLNFARLLHLVDSVKNIDAKTLTKILMNLNEIRSTTTNWKRIELVNNKKEVLAITSNYYEPNAFYFPWEATLNGYKISTPNIDINRFVNRVYPGFLNNPIKVKVLHAIVKSTY